MIEKKVYESKIAELEADIEARDAAIDTLQRALRSADDKANGEKARFLGGLQGFLNSLYKDLARAQQAILEHLQHCNKAVIENNTLQVELKMRRLRSALSGKAAIGGKENEGPAPFSSSVEELADSGVEDLTDYASAPAAGLSDE